MKMVKYLMISLAATLMMASCSSDDDNDVVIGVNDLPTVAQTFLQDYFSGVEVARVEKDTNATDSYYEVKLNNGTEVNFNTDGAWTDVDCKTNAVPDGIVPATIVSYVAENYPDLLIVQIEKEAYGYDIDLSNDLELSFDPEGLPLNNAK